MLKFEQHIPVTKPCETIIDLLTDHCQSHFLSISQLKKAAIKRALWISRNNSTQRLRKVKKALHQNDMLHFYYDEKVLNHVPEPAMLIDDMQHYSVWYKPYGMLSQGSKWSDHCTIARWAETNLLPQRPAFIVHRLDRATTGLIIIAHSKKIAQSFSRIFENHQLDKTYQAIVHGVFDNNSPTTVTTNIDNKAAKSTFSLLDICHNNKLSLLKINIETGRKHQIRKHAKSIDFPIVGDRLYGSEAIELPPEVNLQLCAVRLAFKCPVDNINKCFELPEELSLNLTQLAKSLTSIND